MRNPTIRDVAKRAGVGIGTVSRVLNNSPQVREGTRRRVLSAIEELGFSPNAAARQLSGGKTYTVGVISPFFTNPSFVERLAGVQEVLDGTNYDLVLYSIRNPEQLDRRLYEIATQNRVDGLLILSLSGFEDDLISYNPDLPVVMVVEEAAANYPYIMIDNPIGGKMATEYLILNDHTLLGFMGDELVNGLGMNASLQRYEGFQAALRENEIPYVDEWCRFGSPTQESAFELAYDLLQNEDRPTAIVAAYDTLAFGIIEAARSLRLRVPQDVAVIGFDDIPAAKIVDLTTIRQPLIESGRLGVQRLLDWLSLGALPQEEHETILPLEIVQRGTV